MNHILSSFKLNSDIESVKKLVDYFKEKRDDEEVHQLAEILAYSGDVLEKGLLSADIPSTGGPSSLSTIIGPLFLAASGFEVRKLGVSGRPAGGIDVLAQLSGYRTEFTITEINNYLMKGEHYVHFESGGRFAPLDAFLFDCRRKMDAVNVPQLAIASLLSKKIAVGLEYVNLDVRASEFGNFGSTFEECVNNSKRFCAIASLSGVKARCTISDANIPYQPFIGRRESLIAIYKLLYDKSSDWLDDHYSLCARMSNELMKCHKGSDEKSNHIIDKEAVKKEFEHNILFQGSTIDDFFEKVNKGGKETIITATKEGWIDYHLQAIRRDIVLAQNIQLSKNDYSPKYPDPFGVELLVKPGTHVHENEDIIKIRSRTDTEILVRENDWFSILPNLTCTINDRRVEVV